MGYLSFQHHVLSWVVLEALGQVVQVALLGAQE
jgi:hypothetical protein